MRAWCDRADSFTGLPRGTANHFEFLAAFKEAEPYLGLPRQTYKLVDWLVRCTQSVDWEEGSRPIWELSFPNDSALSTEQAGLMLR
jgi:replication initiation protein RepC